MRMERLRRAQDSCILVRGDGQYHLEVVTPGKVSVLEGTLSPESLRDLIRLLSQDRLFRLQQKDIHTPLVESDMDQLILGVLRPIYVWQSLSFPTAESRYPFRETLDPLLDWLEQAQKQKARKLSEEEGRNSCLVPGEIRLKQRPPKKNAEEEETGVSSPRAGSSTDERAPPSNPYVLRLFTMQMDRGRVEDTCLIVFASGTYHGVRQSERFGSKEIKTAVLDGNFPPEDLNSLRATLDNAELQKFAGPAMDRVIGEGLLTHLTIPRNGKVQQLTVWKAFNAYSWYAAQTMRANEQGAKLLRPFTEWIKTKLPRSQERDSTGPPNPKCLATP
jgi:hypothetical protein